MRLLCVDVTPGALISANTGYILGSRLFAGKFDVVVACRRPEDFFRAIEKHPRADVQVWGHGQPGRAGIGGTRITADDARWRNVKSVWFRSCKVMQGADGKQFAQDLADAGVFVAGHLANIGGFGHSYLVGLAPGRRAWWPASLTPQHSHPFAPRTVSPLAMTLPTWTFRESI